MLVGKPKMIQSGEPREPWRIPRHTVTCVLDDLRVSIFEYGAMKRASRRQTSRKTPTTLMLAPWLRYRPTRDAAGSVRGECTNVLLRRIEAVIGTGSGLPFLGRAGFRQETASSCCQVAAL